MRESSRWTKTSPPASRPSWSYRPLQSVANRRCSGLVGLPAPGATGHSQNVRPIRSSCHRSRPRMRLRRQSSHGVRPSFTVFPESPRLASLDPRHLSWGSFPLQRMRGRESTSVPVARPGSPVSRVAPAGPIPLVTVPLTGFLNLSATSSSLRLSTIFGWVALVGFALQGFDPHAKPRRLVAADVPS